MNEKELIEKDWKIRNIDSGHFIECKRRGATTVKVMCVQDTVEYGKRMFKAGQNKVTEITTKLFKEADIQKAQQDTARKIIKFVEDFRFDDIIYYETDSASLITKKKAIELEDTIKLNLLRGLKSNWGDKLE